VEIGLVVLVLADVVILLAMLLIDLNVFHCKWELWLDLVNSGRWRASQLYQAEGDEKK